MHPLQPPPSPPLLLPPQINIISLSDDGIRLLVWISRYPFTPRPDLHLTRQRPPCFVFYITPKTVLC